MMKSLKTRLVLILLALILVAWLASALISVLFVGRVMLEQVDSQLAQYSALVSYITRVFSRRVEAGLPLSEPWLRGEYETAHLQPIVIEALEGDRITPALNIWLEESLIAVMAGSPHFDRPLVEGYALVEGGNGNWRVLSRYDEVTELWTQVAIELRGARLAMIRMMGNALLPLLLVLPLTIILLYVGVSRGLLPLRALAGQIGRRSPALLDPVATEGVPGEMRGVVSSLNGLLRRLALALESEQRFTANAAHELLTPLAAIKAEVQLCQLQLGDERGGEMLGRIARRVDRASHTVEQLLTLARLDPDGQLPTSRVRLGELLQEVLADTAHLAHERGLEVDITAAQEVEIDGSREALGILLRNLLVNAFRYASEQSAVGIELAVVGEAVELVVHNDCEPLSPQQFERISERFYRVPGAPGQGAGLGLSIVARIAEQHGATMAVGPRAAGRGFRVGLRFASA